jgi:hypothetical protein
MSTQSYAILASLPMASYGIHLNRIISITSNVLLGVCVSLAYDIHERGCDIVIYSVRNIHSHFVRTLYIEDTSISMSMVTMTSIGHIVLYGLKGNIPILSMYSLNGIHLYTIELDEIINVLQCTKHMQMYTGGIDFIVTGGRKGQIVFRSTTE